MNNLREFTKDYLSKNKYSSNSQDLEHLIEYFKEAEKFKVEFMKENLHCSICDKKLSPIEIGNISVMDFQFCCQNHLNFRDHFNTGRAREQAGKHYSIRDIPDFYR